MAAQQLRNNIFLTAAVGFLAGLLIWCGRALVPADCLSGPACWAVGAAATGRRNFPADGMAGFEEILALILLAAGLVLAAWWLLSLLVTAAAVVVLRTSSSVTTSRLGLAILRLSPVFLRRLASAVLGAQLAAGSVALAVPTAASASVTASAPVPTAASTVASMGASAVAAAAAAASKVAATSQTRLPGGPGIGCPPGHQDADPGPPPPVNPVWTPSPPPARTGLLVPGRRPGVPEPRLVTVLRGDSLWAIAARELGGTANDADIAAAWRHIYRANASVVGPDPDLLLPGQELLVPHPLG